MTDKDFVPRTLPTERKGRAVRIAPRTNVVPKTCRLNITNAKISGIYSELKTLQLGKHVHAIGVLLRVFLELSVDDYLKNKAGLLLSFKDPKSGREIHKKLKDKVKETITHMVANGADEKDFKGITTAINNPDDLVSVETLHAYIQNRFFSPTDTYLTTAWDNAQRFFETIWR